MEKSKVSKGAAAANSGKGENISLDSKPADVIVAVETPDTPGKDSLQPTATEAAKQDNHPARNQDIFPAKGVEAVIGQQLLTIPGVIPVDSKLAGLGGRGFPRVVAQLDPIRKVAVVEAAIAVVWPSPVTRVAEEARRAIAETVTAYTGYKTTRANVVVGHAEPGTRVTAAAIEERRPISARKPISRESDIRQPVTTRGVEIRNVELLDDPKVRSISTPSEKSVQSIPVPEPPQLTEIVTADSANLVEVPEPKEPQVRSISAPATRELAAVSVRESVEVVKPEAPKERQLVEVNYNKANVWKPTTREGVNLREVEAPEVEPRVVEAPAQKPLRRVVTPDTQPRSVQAPRKGRLKQVTVNSKPLREISIAPSAPVRHVPVPEPTPLRSIEVIPANAEQLRRAGR